MVTKEQLAQCFREAGYNEPQIESILNKKIKNLLQRIKGGCL